MIKSENGHIEIKGANIDIIPEWVCLYRQMIKYHPELVSETCLAFKNELINAEHNLLIVEVIRTIIKAIKGVHDNE